MASPGHAPFAALLDLAEAAVWETGREHGEVQTWRGHVSECPTCRERMARIESLLRGLKHGDAGDAPSTWIERALELGASPARPFRAMPLTGALVAEIAFDSRVHGLVGVRAGASEVRQLVLTSAQLEIEVTVLPPESREPWAISGQVFTTAGAAPDRVDVRLEEGGRIVERTATRPTGEFALERRPRGEFRLRFEGSGWSLESPPLMP